MVFPVPLSGSRDFCFLNPRPLPVPCKEKKHLKHSHFLLLWCPCISVVRSFLISTMVWKVLPHERISGTLVGAGGEGNGNHPSVLAWRTLRSLACYRPWGCKESDTTWRLNSSKSMGLGGQRSLFTGHVCPAWKTSWTVTYCVRCRF